MDPDVANIFNHCEAYVKEKKGYLSYMFDSKENIQQWSCSDIPLQNAVPLGTVYLTDNNLVISSKRDKNFGKSILNKLGFPENLMAEHRYGGREINLFGN